MPGCWRRGTEPLRQPPTDCGLRPDTSPRSERRSRRRRPYAGWPPSSSELPKTAKWLAAQHLAGQQAAQRYNVVRAVGRDLTCTRPSSRVPRRPAVDATAIEPPQQELVAGHNLFNYRNPGRPIPMQCRPPCRAAAQPRDAVSTPFGGRPRATVRLLGPSLRQVGHMRRELPSGRVSRRADSRSSAVGHPRHLPPRDDRIDI